MSAAPTAAFDLPAFLSRERARIEAIRADLVDTFLAGAPEQLGAAIRYALDAGGKRLRPILCVAAYRAAAARRARPEAGGSPAEIGAADASAGGQAPPGIYRIGAALELIHTYSLVHDDLPCMDDDDLRRGRPTTHRRFGEACAIVAGFALIPLACRAAGRGAAELGLPPHERAALVRTLCAAAGAGGMVGGQWLDLEAEGRRLPLERLVAIHERKTGALLAASLRIGAQAARADAAVVQALAEYGRRIGLAFQIADDVLDVTGSTAVLGKTAGRDADLAKATFPGLLGLDRARERARAEADAAVDALRTAGVATPELEALAHYTVERDR